MKIRYLIEIDDETRKALAYHYGEKGKATRKTVKTTIDMLIEAWSDDLQSDYSHRND